VTLGECDVRRLAVLPDGRIAAGCLGEVDVLDPAGKPPIVFHGDFEALAVLPDGRIAAGLGYNTLRVWDPAGRKGPMVFRVAGRYAYVMALAVLPDGRIAASGGRDTFWVFDPR
jgi:WD40 repeat protein